MHGISTEPRASQKLYNLMKVLNDPSRWFQKLWRRYPYGPLDLRVAYDISPRPWYLYSAFHAARQACRLGNPAVTVIEIGVANGAGLLYLEKAAAEAAEFFGVRIDVIGFDLGEGLPRPKDYRDLPYVFDTGFYKMDHASLRGKLAGAELILGEVSETIPAFRPKPDAPIGFVAIDVDYYSSARDALQLFEMPEENFIPRVYCYFDDVLSDDLTIYCQQVGEWLAIAEFNAAHKGRAIEPILGLSGTRPMPAGWNQKMFACHLFEHPGYCKFIDFDGGEWDGTETESAR